ncbi:hypothetical protein V8C86DRAFT_2672490 [Haematococcus lacustris]
MLGCNAAWPPVLVSSIALLLPAPLPFTNATRRHDLPQENPGLFEQDGSLFFTHTHTQTQASSSTFHGVNKETFEHSVWPHCEHAGLTASKLLIYRATQLVLVYTDPHTSHNMRAPLHPQY